MRCPYGLNSGILGSGDVSLRIVAHKNDLILFKSQMLNESIKNQGMRFSITQLPGYEDYFKELNETKAFNNLSCCGSVGKVGKQSEAIGLSQNTQSFPGPGEEKAKPAKSRKISINGCCYSRIFRRDLYPWLSSAALIQNRLWVSLPLCRDSSNSLM